MMPSKPSEKAQTNRRLALGYLSDAKGGIVSMQKLLQLMGTTDKARVTRDLIKPLQAEGHNIISLAGSGGYMLIEKVSPESWIISELAELKVMVACLIEREVVPVVPVPGYVPERVSSDKPREKTPRPEASACDLSPLTSAIGEAYRQSRPFTKTGRTGSNGIHARRLELPAPFDMIGRDRLERVVAELLGAGRILQDDAGFMLVPGS